MTGSVTAVTEMRSILTMLILSLILPITGVVVGSRGSDAGLDTLALGCEAGKEGVRMKSPTWLEMQLPRRAAHPPPSPPF